MISITTRSYKENIANQQFVVSDLSLKTDWTRALKGQDVVVHCAAMLPRTGLSLFNRKIIHTVNSEGTLSLVRQAAAMRVKRFIFISSIAVNGQFTVENTPFRASDIANPFGDYGVSKLNGERAVSSVASKSNMDFVILRAPALYGPGMNGSISTLAAMIESGVPLPIRCVKNKRSFLGVYNFVNILTECLTSERCRNRVLLLSDLDDVSTFELSEIIADLKQSVLRTFNPPQFLLDGLMNIKISKNITHSLISNLEIDSKQTFDLLSLRPKQTLKEGLRCCF